jgi:hypothetical protein
MAEVVRDLPPAADAPEPWVQPIPEGVWVDPSGTQWKLRRSLSMRRIERLLESADVEVLLCYGPDAPSRVVLAERRTLWERALPYLEGRPRSRGDHADFAVGEFQNGQRTLVIFEESC